MDEDRSAYLIIPAVPGFQLLTFWFEDDELDPHAGARHENF